MLVNSRNRTALRTFLLVAGMATLAMGVFFARAPIAFPGQQILYPTLILITLVQFYIAFRLRKAAEHKGDAERNDALAANRKMHRAVGWAALLFVIICGVYVFLYLQAISTNGPTEMDGFAAIFTGVIAVLLGAVRRMMERG